MNLVLSPFFFFFFFFFPFSCRSLLLILLIFSSTSLLSLPVFTSGQEERRKEKIYRCQSLLLFIQWFPLVFFFLHVSSLHLWSPKKVKKQDHVIFTPIFFLFIDSSFFNLSVLLNLPYLKLQGFHFLLSSSSSS